MAAVELPPSMIPERRRLSPEIIDVDLLADDDSRPAQRRRLSSFRPPRPGVITIVDSDDEEVQAGPSRLRPGPFNNHRIFSPPPPPQDNAVPPVPPLPRHLHSQRSLPMRRHPPPHPSGIVRPNERPFPFEANVRAGQNQTDNGPPPPLAAAPPSHHIPAMGFGGALLAMHRPNQDAHPHANHSNRGRGRRLPRVQSSWILPSFGNILSGDFVPRRRSSVQEEDIIFADSDEDEFFNFFASNADDHYHGGRPPFASHFGRRVRHYEPDYKPMYTHPGKPAPGFTFDFAPPTNEPPTSSPSAPVIVVDDSPGVSATAGGSSSSQDDPNTILVCARCMDALITGDSGTGIEHTRRRIWGLRCGHLLDGKCIEEIMKPGPPAAPAEISIANDVKDKGKEIATSEAPRLDKGKGKAVERAPSESHDELNFLPPLQPNSIRSRLRPRPHSASHTPFPPIDVSSTSQRAIRPLPSLRSQASKGKGKGKTKATLVEAEHHWRCPVQGCAKVHTSILVEGKWIMDDKAGAIAVYV